MWAPSSSLLGHGRAGGLVEDEDVGDLTSLVAADVVPEVVAGTGEVEVCNSVLFGVFGELVRMIGARLGDLGPFSRPTGLYSS